MTMALEWILGRLGNRKQRAGLWEYLISRDQNKLGSNLRELA
jgi:hypothetical protein